MLNNLTVSLRGNVALQRREHLTEQFSYRPSLLRKSAYYLQRSVVLPFMRRSVVRTLGLWIGKKVFHDSADKTRLEILQMNGIVRLDNALSESQCTDIAEYLSDKPVYNKNFQLDNAFAVDRPDEMNFGIYMCSDVLDCPHIMDLVCSPKIVQLAADYLGCTPTLSTLGVQWSFPASVAGVAQKFHRDTEDWKYLRFIIYLTDVDEGCGPHVYISGSHRDRLSLRLQNYLPEEILHRYGVDKVTKVYGKRGTGIAADTSGIHKGEQPSSKPRLVLTFTFSILPNPLSKYQPLKTRHVPGRTKHVTRLFLK